MNVEKRLLIIDGFNLLSRAYFATSYGRSETELSRNAHGLFTNALRVTFQKLIQLRRELQTTHLVFAWDVKRDETKRKQLYAEYKETRGELPDGLIQQFHTLQTILEHHQISQLSIPQYEADDIVGTLTTRWSEEVKSPCYIYSNDRDLLQLLNPYVTQIIGIPKQGDIHYGYEQFKSEYSIEPQQWIDVKALLGDKSDNIPGVPGVGEKAALPLIQDYHSVEGVYQQLDQLDPKYKRYQKKLQAGEEFAHLSKKLCQIICDIPEVLEMEWQAFESHFTQQSLLSHLEEMDIRVRVSS